MLSVYIFAVGGKTKVAAHSSNEAGILYSRTKLTMVLKGPSAQIRMGTEKFYMGSKFAA